MKGSLLLPLLSLIPPTMAQWGTLMSPSNNRAYLKLSTDDLIQIDYNSTFTSGQSITSSSLISPPTTNGNNYSLAMANDNLYAFYQETSTKAISISLFQDDLGDWEPVDYESTLSSNTTQFFDESVVMTSYDEDTDKQVIYIYGGRQSDTITNRLLQFDPTQGTLQSVMTSVAPTSFYGASNAILDTSANGNIVVGGKASSGWVSMFQIAVFEYGSWTFKTISQSSFSVNSRVNPLVLPVFGNEGGEEVESVVVLGGTLGPSSASPQVLILNMTDGWQWQNFSDMGDFKLNGCLGGVVINETFISITESTTSNKRDESGYEIQLFSINNFNSIESLKFYDNASSSSAVGGLSSSTKSSTASVSSSHIISSTSKVSSSTSSIASTITSSISSSTTTPTKTHSKNKTAIIVATVVPIISISIITMICWLLWKKYHTSSHNNNDTQSDNTEFSDEYLKEMTSFDQASITSWNAKRDEFTRSMNTLHTPTKGQPAEQFTFEGTTPVNNNTNGHGHHVRLPSHGMSQTGSTLQLLTKVYKSSTDRRRSVGPFANPEDYADKQQELSPMSQSNKSHSSFFSTAGSGDLHDQGDIEEQKIDKFLSERDVQVLVSSKRRSKLRITNPDLLDDDVDILDDDLLPGMAVDEDKATLEMESTDTGSTLSVGADGSIGKLDDDLLLDFAQDREYFRDVLRAFDDDDRTTRDDDRTTRDDES